MYTVIRTYKGNPTIADQFVSRRKDIETLIRGVPGLIAYYMVKTTDGAATVTVCETQQGTEQSTRLAADFIKQNLPGLTASAPEISAGDVVMTVTGQTATR